MNTITNAISYIWNWLEKKNYHAHCGINRGQTVRHHCNSNYWWPSYRHDQMQCCQMVAMAERRGEFLKKCHQIAVAWRVANGGVMAVMVAWRKIADYRVFFSWSWWHGAALPQWTAQNAAPPTRPSREPACRTQPSSDDPVFPPHDPAATTRRATAHHARGHTPRTRQTATAMALQSATDGNVILFLFSFFLLVFVLFFSVWHPFFSVHPFLFCSALFLWYFSVWHPFYFCFCFFFLFSPFLWYFSVLHPFFCFLCFYPFVILNSWMSLFGAGTWLLCELMKLF